MKSALPQLILRNGDVRVVSSLPHSLGGCAASLQCAACQRSRIAAPHQSANMSHEQWLPPDRDMGSLDVMKVRIVSSLPHSLGGCAERKAPFYFGKVRRHDES